MSLSELKSSLDDKVWEIYSKGLTCTVNQVDSDFGTNICKRYKPKSIEDIAKICAAIRPSFNAWREQFLSRKPYSNGNKKMDELLKYTDHYILFQENVMQYFEWLSVSPAESIGLIKKISKKKIHPEDFKNLENRIKDGWIKQCGSLDGFQENWDMIQGCIAYSFNSPHALGYAYDSLYCAYLKSHYPLEYYSVVLNIYKNDEVRTAKLTKELEYFKIKLKNPKFRYSKSDYYFDEDTKTIYKGIGSIKYLNEEVSNSLYELRDRKYNSFIELLYDLKDIDIDSRQLEILIKLDYFSEFGNSKELLRLVLFFNFFKKGEMKSVSKEKLECSDVIRTIVAQHSTETPKKYKDLDNKEILKEVEEYVRSLNIEDFGFKDKIQSQLEYTGYISLITGKKEDKPKEVALNVKTMYSKDGDRKPWAVVIQGQSIGSGIKNDFTIPYNKFSHHPFSKYDIIHIKKFHKSPKGYWYIDSYEVLI